MGSLVYQVISSAALFTLGIYHLITTTRNYLKSPLSYAAKPFHPFPYPRRLPLYLVITSLLLAMAHHLLISADADPLVRGATAVHRITSLQSAASLFLFLLLALALLLADASPALLPLPPDLSFALASALFLLHASPRLRPRLAPKPPPSKAKMPLRLPPRLSHLSAPPLPPPSPRSPGCFPADVALSAAFRLRGFWAFRAGSHFYANAFIPEGLTTASSTSPALTKVPHNAISMSPSSAPSRSLIWRS
eukprot:XP_025982042.1 uncharacterized protein LOC100791374 [Glycine max]